MIKTNLLENFSDVASSQDGIKYLRQLIISLAVRGRLTSQSNSETQASEALMSATRKVNNRSPLILDSEKPFPIPLTWEWFRLGEIVDFYSGKTPARQEQKYWDDGKYPWVSISDMVPGGFINATKEKISQVAFDEVFRQEITPKGTMLLSFKLSIGKLSILNIDAFHNEAIVSIHPVVQDFQDYLFKCLNGFDILREASSAIKGKTLNRKALENIVVALPPLEEQKRISAKVDELMSLCDQLMLAQNQSEILRQNASKSLIENLVKAEELKELRFAWRKISSNSDELLNTQNNVDALKDSLKTLAVLGKLVNPQALRGAQKPLDLREQQINPDVTPRRKPLPPLSEDEIKFTYPKHWTVARFDDFGTVSGGVTKGKRYKNKKISSYPYMRVANVQRGYFSLDSIQEIEIPEDEFEKYALKSGDILITEGGDWDKVGRTAIWREQIPNCLHQNHVFKARLTSSGIKQEWVELFFNSSIGRLYWEGAAKQTTNLASINMTQVRSIPVPIPSKEEQEHILRQLSNLLTICDNLQDRLDKHQDMRDRFSQATINSILQDTSGRKIMPIEESFLPKPFKRQISIEIALAGTKNKNLNDTKLAIILQENGGKMEAKELWQASKLKEIDDFYAFLKQEIEDGFIQQPSIAEIKLIEEANNAN